MDLYAYLGITRNTGYQSINVLFFYGMFRNFNFETSFMALEVFLHVNTSFKCRASGYWIEIMFH